MHDGGGVWYELPDKDMLNNCSTVSDLLAREHNSLLYLVFEWSSFLLNLYHLYGD